MAESNRFLVVEDDPEVGSVCELVLSSQGFEVEVVETAAEARQRAAGKPLRGVLLDYKLPDSDGLELFQDLRAQQPDLLGLLMTGYGSLELAVTAQRQGLAGFLPKPFTAAYLQMEVQRVLDRQRWQQEVARLQLLHQLQQRLQTLWSLHEAAAVYDFTLEVALQEARAERVSLQRWTGQDLLVVAAQGPGADELLAAFPRNGHSVARWVLDTRQPLRLDAHHPPPPELRPYLQQPAIRAALCMPLMAQEKVWGVLNLSRFQDGEPFSEEAVEQIHLLSAQVALALDRLDREAHSQQQEKLATVGHLVSRILHDVRNPLQVIIHCTELLTDSTDPAVKRYVPHLQTQSQRLTELCQEVLDYVQGQTRLHLERRPAPEWLTEVVAEQNIPDSLHLDFQLTYTGPVEADPRKLRRALVNLITNACEAMPEGGILRLGTRADAEAVWFVVEDTGVGIPPAVQARLGEPFFTHGKPGGTGLGLAIVRSIAEAHGGQLRFTSQVGRGTCAELGLPHPVVRTPEVTVPALALQPPLPTPGEGEVQWARVVSPPRKPALSAVGGWREAGVGAT